MIGSRLTKNITEKVFINNEDESDKPNNSNEKKNEAKQNKMKNLNILATRATIFGQKSCFRVINFQEWINEEERLNELRENKNSFIQYLVNLQVTLLSNIMFLSLLCECEHLFNETFFFRIEKYFQFYSL